MSLNIQCVSSGVNTGTVGCPVTKGIPKYIAIWAGSIPAATLANGFAAAKAVQVADSKRGKTSASKLILFPLIKTPTIAKAANSEVTFADQSKITTQEGLGTYTFKSISDTYQTQQLRKLNGRKIKYTVFDHKYQEWGTLDSTGAFVGCDGVLQINGEDFHGVDRVDGEIDWTLSPLDGSQVWDFSAAIQFDSNPGNTFSQLIDVQLYEKAAYAGVLLKVSAKVTNNPAVINVIDIYDDYSAGALGSNAALWSVKKVSDGSVATIASVAPNAAGYFQLTMGSALTAATAYTVSTVDPVALAAAGVLGIETVSYTFTTP